MGIAVAFYLGFKNNSSYDRTWEARKIWGSIVNNSRSFGSAVMAFVQSKEHKEEQQELIYRRLAWLTCLRFNCAPAESGSIRKLEFLNSWPPNLAQITNKNSKQN